MYCPYSYSSWALINLISAFCQFLARFSQPRCAAPNSCPQQTTPCTFTNYSYLILRAIRLSTCIATPLFCTPSFKQQCHRAKNIMYRDRLNPPTCQTKCCFPSTTSVMSSVSSCGHLCHSTTINWNTPNSITSPLPSRLATTRPIHPECPSVYEASTEMDSIIAILYTSSSSSLDAKMQNSQIYLLNVVILRCSIRHSTISRNCLGSRLRREECWVCRGAPVGRVCNSISISSDCRDYYLMYLRVRSSRDSTRLREQESDLMRQVRFIYFFSWKFFTNCKLVLFISMFWTSLTKESCSQYCRKIITSCSASNTCTLKFLSRYSSTAWQPLFRNNPEMPNMNLTNLPPSSRFSSLLSLFLLTSLYPSPRSSSASPRAHRSTSRRISPYPSTAIVCSTSTVVCLAVHWSSSSEGLGAPGAMLSAAFSFSFDSCCARMLIVDQGMIIIQGRDHQGSRYLRLRVR